VAITVVAILACNYSYTGVAEVTPFYRVLSMSDPLRRPPSLLFHWLQYIGEQEGSIDGLRALYFKDLIANFWLHLINGVFSLVAWRFLHGLLAMVIAGIFLWRRFRRSDFSQVEGYLFLLSFSLLVVTFGLSIVIKQGSFARGLLFLPAFRVVLFGVILLSVFKTLENKIRTKWYYKKRNVLLVLFAFADVSFLHFQNNSLDIVNFTPNFSLEPPRFAFGLKSFADYYGFKKNDPCTEAREAVDPNARIMLLHIQPACVGKPSDRIEKGDPVVYLDDNRQLSLLKNPLDARTDLEKQGVNHFLFVPGWESSFFAFLPLFREEAMLENFRLEKTLDQGYLLTWRKQNDDKIPTSIMELYKKQLADSLGSKDAVIYKRWLAERAQGIR